MFTFVASKPYSSMRIIHAELLEGFALKHAQAARPLEHWRLAVERARWKSHADLKRDFPSADYVGNGRYVFNIKGNSYRLVAIVIFFSGKAVIRFVGTHPEYDRIDASNI